MKIYGVYMGFNEYNQFFGLFKSFADPEFFSKSFNNFKPSGIDFSSFSENSKKNLELLSQANQIVSKNLQELAKKGAEIFRNETENLFNNFKNIASSENPEQASEKHKQYINNALASSVNNGKEIFDLLSKSSNEVLQFFGQNFSHNCEPKKTEPKNSKNSNN